MPFSFIEWCYDGRAELVRRIASGAEVPREKIFLGFTRHSPAIVTFGPAGPNGSIKGVGFVPKREFVKPFLSRYMGHIRSEYSDDYARRGLEILSETIYGPDGQDKVDFSRLATLELAKAHTWVNIQENRNVSLVFFEPPGVSFEVRAIAEIHAEGLYHSFVNAQHDVYHRPNMEKWNERPAYIFDIQEIYDNSATKRGFGTLIYRKPVPTGNS